MDDKSRSRLPWSSEIVHLQSSKCCVHLSFTLEKTGTVVSAVIGATFVRNMDACLALIITRQSCYHGLSRLMSVVLSACMPEYTSPIPSGCDTARTHNRARSLIAQRWPRLIIGGELYLVPHSHAHPGNSRVSNFQMIRCSIVISNYEVFRERQLRTRGWPK